MPHHKSIYLVTAYVNMGGVHDSMSGFGGDLCRYADGDMVSTSASAKVKECADMPSSEAWTDKDQQIQVAEGNGFLFKLKLRAKVDGTPSFIYDILTDPNSVDIFRSIKACIYRKVVEEDKAKKQRKLEVAHRSFSRFLFISVTFETRLFVWEDDMARKIRFCNANEDGFMKKFEGLWHVQPFNQKSIDGPSGSAHYTPTPMFRLPNPFTSFSQTGLGGSATSTGHCSTLATLEQSILPRNVPPGFIKGIVRRLCAKQLSDMMEDLRTEVKRREGLLATGNKRTGVNGGPAAPSCKQGGVAAASMSISWPRDIWEHAAPIKITIQL